jgi:phospholipid transport system substrate-binding protein
MSVTRRDFVLGSGLAIVTGAGSAQAATDPQGAAAFVRQLGEQALGLLRNTSVTLEQREAAFRNLLRDGFDLDFIGRFTLGRHANRLTPDQHADFREAFGEFILKTYARRLSAYSGEVFTVTGAQRAGEHDALVSSRIDRPGGAPPLMADWRVRDFGGRYKVIDVVVQGVSMAVTQRQEFASVINTSGVNGLIAQLRARADKAPAMAARS